MKTVAYEQQQGEDMMMNQGEDTTVQPRSHGEQPGLHIEDVHVLNYVIPPNASFTGDLVQPNLSSQPVPSTNMVCTVSVTRSISATVDVSLEADLGAFVEGIKAKLDLSVTMGISETSSVGVTCPAFTIPPNNIGYANYGIMCAVTSLHYYHVDQRGQRNDDEGYATVTAPIGKGWLYWTTPSHIGNTINITKVANLTE